MSGELIAFCWFLVHIIHINAWNMKCIKTVLNIPQYTTVLPLLKHFSCGDEVKKFKTALIMVKL